MNTSASRSRTLRFETFDSSIDINKDKTLVYRLIQRHEISELESHLINTQDDFDITTLYDKSGYSPLHYAAYRNSFESVQVLCDFLLGKHISTLDADESDRRMKQLR